MYIQQANGRHNSLRRIALVLCHSSEQNHTNTLADGTKKHKFAPTETLDEWNGNKRREEICKACRYVQEPKSENSL